MTSLELFPASNHVQKEPLEWGTGKLNRDAKADIWTPKTPTWHYSGEPTQQHYGLTQLKLSNIRSNDQLLPEPHHSNMHPLVIQKQFPAEHPFTSHIPRFAVFPTFESPADPRKGVEARSQKPKDATMPAQPYDYVVIKQTKGSGFRHEVQFLPPESEKEALEWKSHDFDQFPKSPWNEKQDFYPIPPKLFVPSHKKRSNGNCIRGDLQVSTATADTTKNVEQNQWNTTYDLNHTGLGPSNTMALDNWDSKLPNDALAPRSVPTFDPPRPKEGRIARMLVPSPPPQTDKFPDPHQNSEYTRKSTLSEIEEDRLWNGNKYSNYPENLENERNTLWKEQQMNSHPVNGLENLRSIQDETLTSEVPHKPQQGPAEYPSGVEAMDTMLSEHHLTHQQVEAANRWALLEGMTPDKDLTSLHHKMDITNTKTQPHTFYGHEGKYLEERAGLYKTSYDPAILQHSLNKGERNGAQAVDTSNYQRNALDLPVALNQEVAEDLRHNRTIGGPPGSVIQLNSQPSQFEVFGPFEKARSLQKAKLQPNASTAAAHVQEGGVVLRESTQGEGYNTEKFLQKNRLGEHMRNEPNVLMSADNQNLLRVYPATETNERVPGKRRLVMPHEWELPNLERPVTSPMPCFRERYSYQDHPGLVTKVIMGPTRSNGAGSFRLEHSQSLIQKDQLLSKSSNFCGSPTILLAQPVSQSVDLTFKNDSHFNWKPGSGTPRPQTILLDLQNSFIKSDVRKNFRQKFPENLPDLRENITRGKKHSFGNFNAQVLRGTHIVPVQ
ncbi:hypothetical protein CAPTEDRAFT_227900 [Capitella teleta]|uniref:Uncharacterized protein n=1 Tax=Capitella teleta TaxID=283909 RepID=R7U5G2_CAPTE|nr:hypothetical protein CAPTEDRAFT_227900 [Capitella teleta]|eukprot:ELU01610.1 hypothetical protein CAPTEDRAFT_227900 [Capitella teleta]